MADDDFKEGVDWNKEKNDREQTKQQFGEEYKEAHYKSVRINKPPEDGQIYQEGGQEASILSDGENGRLATISHSNFIRCDCGCIVKDIQETVKDSTGKIFCQKHGNLFCRLCSQLILPGCQVKINESYYHRKGCALKVVNSILAEEEEKPGAIPPVVLGELKALKSSLQKEKLYGEVKQITMKIRDIFGGYRTNAVKTKE